LRRSDERSCHDVEYALVDRADAARLFLRGEVLDAICLDRFS
jgi:hypothetical protein